MKHIFENWRKFILEASSLDNSLKEGFYSAIMDSKFWQYPHKEEDVDLIDPDLLDGQYSIFHANEIVIPIKTGRILLSVKMESNVIELRDFQGYSPSNRQYFTIILRYLYFYRIFMDGAPMRFEDFANEWDCEDVSLLYSVQEDGTDYGMLALLNGELLARDAGPGTFSKEQIRSCTIRRQIVGLICRNGKAHDEYREDLAVYRKRQEKEEKSALMKARLKAKQHESFIQERRQIIEESSEQQRRREHQGKRMRQHFEQQQQQQQQQILPRQEQIIHPEEQQPQLTEQINGEDDNSIHLDNNGRKISSAGK